MDAVRDFYSENTGSVILILKTAPLPERFLSSKK